MNQHDAQNQEVIDRQVSPPAEKKKSKKASHREAKQELHQAIRGANDVILEIKTPFQVFPTTLTIDRSKITANQGKAAKNKGTMSIPFEDVLNVTAHTSMFYGFVKVDKAVLIDEEPYQLGPFWRKDAQKAASIAQGYVIALKRRIDLSSLSTQELRNMLQQLGEV